ncbi:CDP-glycerol glycerophosphotransferase family protein [Bacillus massilinigeriensis]|uniref:CDP-glycerol glycerophosphotransferase family protein n=1 Tax=Bacillus massilionigeriensis TaxID=1805475 RepID=UPI00096B2C58|nr:CDP-glycerol glycerophosphotransferase family protein [Bacillus massilionigeriensis]
MAREFVINAYLFLFKLIFNLCKIVPLKNKVTFVVSFGDNCAYVYEEMKKEHYPAQEFIFLKKKGCKYNFHPNENTKIIPFETLNVVEMARSIFHLATSKYVVIDNYYGFLAATRFKEGTECIQLWHAAGAIKKFGLEDPSNAARSKQALKRFKQVYRNFHKVVVGSDHLAKIYFDSFGINEQNILRTGIPRTDLFFDTEKRSQILKGFESLLPNLNGRKIILYAPTYREKDLDEFSLHLDLAQLHDALSETHVVILRLHQAAVHRSNEFSQLYPDFVYDLTSYPELNEILFLCDYLITDYSSIPFEFSILERPMIFYPYDLEEYQVERGFWEDYETFVPGPVAYSTEEIIKIISSHSFDYYKIKTFGRNWNKYSNGESSRKLVEYMRWNIS